MGTLSLNIPDELQLSDRETKILLQQVYMKTVN